MPNHYTPVEVEGLEGPTIFFYGGPFSNFVGNPIRITYPQPWQAQDTGSAILPGGDYTAWYETVEHFFQATKARTRYDHELIRQAPGPGAAKSRGNSRQSWAPGRAGQPLMRDDWEEGTTRYDAMVAGLRAKFEHPEYRGVLLDTGTHRIAEDSPTDFIWGIRDERGGFSGSNLLGLALMQIRAEIREGRA